jgi:hypothetical protein
MVTTMLDCPEPAERRALFARERAQLAARHRYFVRAAQLAARADLFLWPRSRRRRR